MTTGSRPVARPLARRQAARWQQERQRQRWVWALAGVIVFLVMVIPAYGYYATFMAPPRRTAFEVNGVKHSLGEVAKVTRAQVAASAGSQSQPDLSSLPLQVLINLMNDELIAQGAPALGIVVTQEDVDAETRSRLYPRLAEGQQTDPQVLEREFRENLRRYLDVTKFSEAEYRDIVRRSILRQKLQETMSDQIPLIQEQIYAHWIRLGDESAISEAQKRLKDGEAFDRVARVYAQDDPFADDNGEVGWVPRDAFPLLDSTLFSGQRDAVSEPISSPPNTYFIKVTAGPELREVSSTMLQVLKTRTLEKWLDNELKKNDVKVNFGGKEYEWVIDKVRELIPAQNSQNSQS